MVLFYAAPIVYILVKSLSFQTYYEPPSGLTLSNYKYFLDRPFLLRTIWDSVRFGLLLASCSAIIGTVVAYVIHRHLSARLGRVVLALMLFPFLTSYVVRIFAWISILGRDGALNNALSTLGIIDTPITGLLFSRTSTFITVLYVLMPIMVSTVYLVLNQIDGSTHLAAQDLGAGRMRGFFLVTLPLIRPGIGAGFILVFSFATAAFLEPSLVGGTDGTMVSNIISEYFSSIYYERGAALAVIVLLTVGIVLVVVVKLLGDPRRAVGLSGHAGTRSPTRFGQLRVAVRARRDAQHVVVDPVEPGFLSLVLQKRVERCRYTERLSLGARVVGRLAVLVVLVFLVAPLLLIIVVSFKDAPNITLPVGELSLDWYRQLADNSLVQGSIRASVQVGVGAAALATVVALAGAYGIQRSRTRGARVVEGLALLPLVTPPILFGLAWLLFYRLFDVRSSLLMLTIAHACFGLPFAYILIRTAMQSVSNQQLEAAEDLGSGHFHILLRVVAPQAIYGITGAFMTVFVISINEAVIAGFNAGAQSTLPLFILSQFLFRLTPEVNAASTLMLLGTIASGCLAYAVLRLFESRRRAVTKQGTAS